MIVQIRGTSGSGKTTVMRSVMAALGEWTPSYAPKRARPLFYSSGSMRVVGHYETPCGGGDSVGSPRAVMELASQLLSSGAKVVLCESLLLSADVKWTTRAENVLVLFLATPLDLCLKRVTQRRLARGNAKPLNEANTTRTHASTKRAKERLSKAGVRFAEASSDDAATKVLEWIRKKSANLADD